MIVITGATGQLATAVAHHIRRLDPGQRIVGARRAACRHARGGSATGSDHRRSSAVGASR
ncbi:MAG: hypothetical protein E6Q54_22395 [Mycolicibacter arupensis]|uniref:Uncharacterized protein n=1 Tax=Mycolicibacter arupensis TaxID=342002 RepID=A0A5C7XJ36_9MYCO|nr:MAG: hypothetical protein E6Q54_22395 [Mycolicibacter arupensis]